MRLSLLALLVLLLSACVVGDSPDIGPDETPSGPDAPPPKEAEKVFVFAHGFASDVEAFDAELVASIAARGHDVYRSSVPSVEGLAVRGPAFAAEIDRALAQTGADEAHVIAHSMGGLDARYAISTLGYGDRIASLTTVSTPHRGSLIADYSLGLIGDETDANRALDAIIAFAGDVDPDALRRNLVDLSVAQTSAFNIENPNDPRVFYQSFSGLATVMGVVYGDEQAACEGVAPKTFALPDPVASSSLLVIAAPFVGDGPADGVVPVSSARWGQFRGCLAVDHTTETGTIQLGTSPLDMLEVYTDLVDELAAR